MPRVAKVLFFFFYTCTPHSPFSPSIFFFFSPPTSALPAEADGCAAAATTPASDSGYKSGGVWQLGAAAEPGRCNRRGEATNLHHPSTPRGVCTTNGGVGGGGEAGRACECETVGENKKKRGPSVINSYVVFVWPASSEDASRARTTSNWIL